MNFVIFTLESQINTDYEMNRCKYFVIKWNTENIVKKLAMKVNVNRENTTIAEILLSEKNLYSIPVHDMLLTYY